MAAMGAVSFFAGGVLVLGTKVLAKKIYRTARRVLSEAKIVMLLILRAMNFKLKVSELLGVLILVD